LGPKHIESHDLKIAQKRCIGFAMLGLGRISVTLQPA